jgi:hypothetical protein
LIVTAGIRGIEQLIILFVIDNCKDAGNESFVFRVRNQQGSLIHLVILPLEHSGKAADGMLGQVTSFISRFSQRKLAAASQMI